MGRGWTGRDKEGGGRRRVRRDKVKEKCQCRNWQTKGLGWILRKNREVRKEAREVGRRGGKERIG